jgi:GYF domain 2
MSDGWHYSDNDTRIGPVSLEALRKFLLSPRGGTTTLVCRGGFAGWKRADEVDELADIAQTPPAIAPARVGPMPEPATAARAGGRASVVFLWVAIVFAILVAAALSTLIYGNSAYGIGYVVGQFLVVGLVGGLIAFFASRGSKNRARAYAIAIAVGAVLVLATNAVKLQDRIELGATRAALQGVNDAAGIEKAAQANPSNHFLGLIAETVRAAAEAQQLTGEIAGKIEPAGITVKLNPAAASLDQLQGFVRDFRAAETNARAALPQFVEIFKGERARVERFGKASGASADMLRSILEGIDTRQARITDLNARMLDARAGLYHALGDRYAVFVEQYGRFQLQANGQFAFSDRAALARFNATAEPINGGAKRIAQLEEEGKQLQQYFAHGPQQLVGGEPN